MVTIKLKLNEPQVEGLPGNLSLCVTLKQKPYNKTLPYCLFPEEWDPVEQKILLQNASNEFRKKKLEFIIEKLKINQLHIKKIIDGFDQKDEYSNKELMEAFGNSSGKQTLSTYITNLLMELKTVNRLRAAAAYQSFLESFLKFNNNKKLLLSQITVSLIEQYEIFLKRQGCNKNTISFYMRTAQVICNQAVRGCAIPLVDKSFFSNVYTETDKLKKHPTLALSSLIEY